MKHIPVILQPVTFQRNGQKDLVFQQNVKVGVGAFDAHLGAVGGEIKPYHLVKVMGTSTCDMLVAPMDRSWR